jgi:hypothetical protein
MVKPRFRHSTLRVFLDGIPTDLDPTSGLLGDPTQNCGSNKWQ